MKSKLYVNDPTTIHYALQEEINEIQPQLFKKDDEKFRRKGVPLRFLKNKYLNKISSYLKSKLYVNDPTTTLQEEINEIQSQLLRKDHKKFRNTKG